ncbi:MAG: YidC/Oxa1 family insertase periplasmic-domain containing protein, partial [Bacteroidota bacterium]
MDKNSITGIVLICAIMFAWMWYSAPSKEEIAKKRIQDSLALVAQQQARKDTVSRQLSVDSSITNAKQLTTNNGQLTNSDSAKAVTLVNKYDVFASAASDSNVFFSLENKKIKATISKKGGRICSVQLKEYLTHDSLPLILFDSDSSSFGLLFDTENNRTINTSELYFQPIAGKNDSTQTLSMRLYANADITGKSNQYIEYEYSLGKDYMLGCKLNFVGLEKIVANNLSEFSLNWAMKTPTQEKDIVT